MYHPPPKNTQSDPEELAEYRLRKRKEFEDLLRRVGRWQPGVWVKVRHLVCTPACSSWRAPFFHPGLQQLALPCTDSGFAPFVARRSFAHLAIGRSTAGLLSSHHTAASDQGARVLVSLC